MNLTYKAPDGVNQIMLKDGTVKRVDTLGYITVDAAYDDQMRSSGFIPGPVDMQYNVMALDGAAASGASYTGASYLAGATRNFMDRTGSISGSTFNEYLPDAATIRAARQNCSVGDMWIFRIANKASAPGGGSIMSLLTSFASAGLSTTVSLVGNVSIASGYYRDFLCTALANGVRIQDISYGQN